MLKIIAQTSFTDSRSNNVVGDGSAKYKTFSKNKTIKKSAKSKTNESIGTDIFISKTQIVFFSYKKLLSKH